MVINRGLDPIHASGHTQAEEHRPRELVWLVDALFEVTGRVLQNFVGSGADVGPCR